MGHNETNFVYVSLSEQKFNAILYTEGTQCKLYHETAFEVFCN